MRWFLVFGAALVAAAPAGAGAAPAPACGQTVTASVRLTADLAGCAGNGLVVGAAGVTIDLGGHTISGTNAKGGEGIAVDGHARVRILNGTIRGFRVNGVALRSSPGSLVRRVRVRAIGAGGKEGEPPSAGIFVKGSKGVRVIDNDVSNRVKAYQSDGVDVIESPGVLVRGNRLVGNAWNGLAFIMSPGGRILDNVFSGNVNQGTEVNASARPLVAGNRATGNGQSGLVVGATSGARVTGNALGGNRQAGVFLFDLRGSLVRGNAARGNRVGIDLSAGQKGSSGNRVAGNRVAASTGVGIGVASPGNRLTGNVVLGNREGGIDAVAGTLDGGGNRASGNTGGPQCRGVAC
jgi:nitrous oxidase accessory protein NosD